MVVISFIDWMEETVVVATDAEAEVGMEVVTMALADNPDLHWKCSRVEKNTINWYLLLSMIFEVAGCGWVCFFENFKLIVLIPMFGGLGTINRF